MYFSSAWHVAWTLEGCLYIPWWCTAHNLLDGSTFYKCRAPPLAWATRTHCNSMKSETGNGIIQGSFFSVTLLQSRDVQLKVKTSHDCTKREKQCSKKRSWPTVPCLAFSINRYTLKSCSDTLLPDQHWPPCWVLTSNVTLSIVSAKII